jgi:hypothetical protein
VSQRLASTLNLKEHTIYLDEQPEVIAAAADVQVLILRLQSYDVWLERELALISLSASLDEVEC